MRRCGVDVPLSGFLFKVASLPQGLVCHITYALEPCRAERFSTIPSRDNYQNVNHSETIKQSQ